MLLRVTLTHKSCQSFKNVLFFKPERVKEILRILNKNIFLILQKCTADDPARFEVTI